MQKFSLKSVAITTLAVISLTACNQAPINTTESEQIPTNDVIQSEPENEVKEIKEIVFEEETDLYTIDVVSPEINWYPELNQYIKAMIDNDISSFKEEVTNDEWYEQDIEDPMMRHGYYSRFEIITFTSKLFSAKFNNSIYYGGAAHPMSYTNVINYDLEKNKNFEIADLFVEESPYVAALSDFCINDFNFRISQGDEWLGDSDWIAEGAGPKESNFIAFNLTAEGLLITFDAYQVAAYAAGPQEVLIPYSELQEILRDDLPLEFDYADYMYS